VTESSKLRQDAQDAAEDGETAVDRELGNKLGMDSQEGKTSQHDQNTPPSDASEADPS
jgi:hypothetical protein